MCEVTGVMYGWMKENKIYIHLWKGKARVCENSSVDRFVQMVSTNYVKGVLLIGVLKNTNFVI